MFENDDLDHLEDGRDLADHGRHCSGRKARDKIVL
jgi:hypothetical protein